MEDLIEDRRLGPQEAGPFCDFLCMHGYPIYADFVESPTDERLLPFLGLITRWLGGREVLFAEFGAPASAQGRCSTRRGSRRYKVPCSTRTARQRLHGAPSMRLHRFGFLGAMLWCYGDYAEPSGPILPGRGDRERWFGLWRADGSPKPAVSRGDLLRTHRTGIASASLPWIDIDRKEFYTRPTSTYADSTCASVSTSEERDNREPACVKLQI